MKTSCIQVKKLSRLSSLDKSHSSTHDASFDGFAKSGLSRKTTLYGLKRVAT